jgi:hypothetical protein
MGDWSLLVEASWRFKKNGSHNPGPKGGVVFSNRMRMMIMMMMTMMIDD